MSDELKKAAYTIRFPAGEFTKEEYLQHIKTAAAILGSKGGKSTSEAKVKASRENGKKNKGKRKSG